MTDGHQPIPAQARTTPNSAPAPRTRRRGYAVPSVILTLVLLVVAGIVARELGYVHFGRVAEVVELPPPVTPVDGWEDDITDLKTENQRLSDELAALKTQVTNNGKVTADDHIKVGENEAAILELKSVLAKIKAEVEPVVRDFPKVMTDVFKHGDRITDLENRPLPELPVPGAATPAAPATPATPATPALVVDVVPEPPPAPSGGGRLTPAEVDRLEELIMAR